MAIYLMDEGQTTIHAQPSKNYSSYMCIRRVKTKEDNLLIPDTIDGFPVLELFLERECSLPGVKTLRLGRYLGSLSITRKNFPDLERVILSEANIQLSLREDLILYEGDKLVAWLSPQKTAHVPAGIRQIGPTAFQDSPVEEILLEEEPLTWGEESFDGSVWQERDGVLRFKEKILAFTREMEEVRIEEGTELALNKMPTHIPKNLYIPSLKDLDSSSQKLSYHKIFVKEAEDPSLGWNTRLDCEGIYPWGETSSIYSVEGVPFLKEEKKLLYHPRRTSLIDVVIPEGTREIDKRVFCFSKALEKVLLPSSLQRIEEEAFYGCLSLIRVEGGENTPLFLSSYPESGSWDLFLPEGITEVGLQAFYGDPLKTVYLPSTLTKLGRQSIEGVEEIWIYEGTDVDLYGAIKCYEESRNCLIHVLGEGKEKLFLIPSLKSRCYNALPCLWGKGKPDYKLLKEIFSKLKMEDKYIAALCLALEEEDSKGEFHTYLKTRAQKAGDAFLEDDRKILFREFLAQIDIKDTAIDALLERCNREGRSKEVAYLLEYKERNRKRTKSSFSL